MLEDAANSAHDVDGMRRVLRGVLTREVTQVAPRPARRMGDDRQVTGVRARVPLLVVPIGDEFGIRPAWVDVERYNI